MQEEPESSTYPAKIHYLLSLRELHLWYLSQKLWPFSDLGTVTGLKPTELFQSLAIVGYNEARV